MLPGQVSQPALHTVAGDSRADGLAHHESDTDRRFLRWHPQVGDKGACAGSATMSRCTPEVLTRREPVLPGQQGRADSLVGSDGDLLAALAATRGQDGATGAGAHAEAETVLLVTATVVRLVGALAHD